MPESGFVFCNFNQSYKLTPGTFASWMRILGQVDGSVLWLLEAAAPFAENIARHAQAHGVAPERILFVTSNGWDAAGAAWYGFTTFWINRSGQPLEALDVTPTASGRTMDDVVAYLTGGRG